MASYSGVMALWPSVGPCIQSCEMHVVTWIRFIIVVYNWIAFIFQTKKLYSIELQSTDLAMVSRPTVNVL